MKSPVNHEASKRIDDVESPVAALYSLKDDQIGRRDVLVTRRDETDRFLVYPAPSDWQQRVMLYLRERGLLLGEQSDPETEDTYRFKVPKEARPVAYDSRMLAKGMYSYYDRRLFGDLGKLLKQLEGSLGDEASVKLAGRVGTNVALVDFTLSEQRGLFLVPGVELYATTDVHADTKDYYSEKLQQEFGSRFSPDVEASFLAGYQAAT